MATKKHKKTTQTRVLPGILRKKIESMTNEKTPRADIIARVAKSAGIDPSTVNEIVDGSIKTPPLKRLQAIAKSLGISSAKLEKATPEVPEGTPDAKKEKDSRS